VVDERRSRAILIYLSKGRRPYPGSDREAVLGGFPEHGPELLTYVEGVLREMKSLPTDWSRETYEHAIERVKAEMARRHPELSRDAIDALGWRFSYDWK